MVAVLQPPKPTRRPILIDEACKILGKAKPTVYTLSRLGVIPSCRQGRKVYFYEDELLEYINSGKVTTAREIRETAEQALYKGMMNTAETSPSNQVVRFIVVLEI
mgnify:CR=1 FL=1